ncbi:MAG: 1-acyl-sn-glycerol-3-phosphate acyltransferase [Patiriisocius sp.]|jgi:1-acyl-sn-glycerol-3-phosphate acyltransferase
MIIFRTIRNILAVSWLIIAGSFGSILLLIGKLFGDQGKWGMLWIKYVFIPPALWILGARVTTTGLDNLDSKKSYVFASNHESHLDTPAIYWQSPRILYFIAKAELRKAPIIGWFISLSGMLFVDRKNSTKAKESLQQAADMIRNGKNIISFPEGSRTKTGEIGQFKKGLFALAIQAKTDVIPVTIHGAREVWPSGTYKTNSGKILIHFGEPVPHTKFETDPIGFSKEVREIVIAQKAKLALKG